MKKIILSVVLLLLGIQLYAQSGQRKVLLQQIAALKVYIDYAKKGYDIARKGLKVIGEVKEGEFNLHSDYFTSLGIVNPAVRDYVRVAETIALELRIMDLKADFITHIGTSLLLTDDEQDYIIRVFEKLEEDCLARLQELDALISNGSLEMSDEERLTRIGLLYNAMLDNYTFCKSFTAEISALVHARERDHKDIDWKRGAQGL